MPACLAVAALSLAFVGACAVRSVVRLSKHLYTNDAVVLASADVGSLLKEADSAFSRGEFNAAVRVYTDAIGRCMHHASDAP